MKILHVYKTYMPENVTGIPRVIFEIAEGLAGQGVESHVLYLSETSHGARSKIGETYIHPVRQHFSVASTSFSFSAFGKFVSLAGMADIVHYHFPWPTADILYLVGGRKKLTIVTYHSDIVKQRNLLRLYKPLMHRFLRGADAIVATSPNYMQTSATLARYRSKVSVIPIGLRDRVLPQPSEIEYWRAEVGTGFFLFVGSLRYYKGLTFLIEAARLTGFPVVIAGKHDSQDEKFLQAPVNVRFLGEISDNDKEALLSLCGAFVLPSHLRSEAFGISLLESARAGKPMISCEIGTGTSYVNANGETGLTVPAADPAALADAMRTLVDTPHRAAAFGRNARARFERLFRGEKMCADYLKLYQQLSCVTMK